MADILDDPQDTWTATQPIPDAKWDQFCSLVADGLTISAAKRRIGFSPSTKWPARFDHMVPKRIEHLKGLLVPDEKEVVELPVANGDNWTPRQILSMYQRTAVDPASSPGDRLKATQLVEASQAKITGKGGVTQKLYPADMKRITAQQAGLPYSGPKEVENLDEPGDALADCERDGMQGLADALKGEGTNG